MDFVRFNHICEFVRKSGNGQCYCLCNNRVHKSKQNFTNSYENFNYYTSHEISFKLQPLSIKNKTTEDIRQYCTECGTKTKTNFKFCPSCGNKL